MSALGLILTVFLMSSVSSKQPGREGSISVANSIYKPSSRIEFSILFGG